MATNYRDYLVRKYGYEDPIEMDGGFLLYRFIGNGECNIGEIYVPSNKRESGIARAMADKCVEIALINECSYLSAQTQITGNDDNLSMLAILHYGFLPLRAENNTVTFYKKIGGTK